MRQHLIWPHSTDHGWRRRVLNLLVCSTLAGMGLVKMAGAQSPTLLEFITDQQVLASQTREVAHRPLPATFPAAGDTLSLEGKAVEPSKPVALDPQANSIEAVFGDVSRVLVADLPLTPANPSDPVNRSTRPADAGVTANMAAGAAASAENVAGSAVPALSPANADVDHDVDPKQESSTPPPSESNTAPPVVTFTPRPMSPPPSYVVSLRRPIEQCLQLHQPLRLNTADDSCWSIMHAFLGWGPATEVNVGGPKGQRTNAIRWLAQNQSCGGRRLFYLEGDHLRGREGPGYQGHPAQFLAMLAQCNIDPKLNLFVGGRSFTVQDLIREEQLTCRNDTELTFKLIGLAHYLGTEANWVNAQGGAWSTERLLQLEMAQPVNGAACGGTHRLMSISFAVQARRLSGKPLDGTWTRAEKYVADYHRYTYSLQNSDGSFSGDWFRRRSDQGNLDRRVQTTGHILEWLVYSLPNESLYDAPVVRAVGFLTQSLTQNRYHEWEVGPKHHAIRALRLYHQRVFEVATNNAGPMARRAGTADVGR